MEKKDSSVISSLQSDAENTVQVTLYNKMRKSIRSWGWWLLGWTVFSLLFANLPWAMVLVTISLMSFYFYDISTMFLVYAGVMSWAAISNILASGEPVWVVVGIIQGVSTIFIIREYRRFRNSKGGDEFNHSPQELPSSPSNDRGSHLGWLSLLLGVLGMVGLLIAVVTGIIIFYYPISEAAEQVVYVVLGAMMELGILGIPVGIAALFTGLRLKAAAVAGIALGVFPALIEIIGILTATAG